MAKLIVRSPEGEQTIVLTPGKLTIGRSPESGIELKLQPTSRHHAELDVRADGVYLTDVGSTAGTSIAGVRLLANQPRLLASGEEFQIGPYLLTYLAEESAQSTEVVAIAEAPKGKRAEAAKQADLAAEPAGAQEAPPPPPPAQQLTVQVVAPLPERKREHYRTAMQRYIQFLPMIFHENEFLARYLQIFESIWEPLEWRADHLYMYFDPRTCPVEMLDWLAGWLDLSINAQWPVSRRRRLLAEAADLYRWRGTRYGLTRMIEVCTGYSPEITEDPATPFVFTVRMDLPHKSEVTAELIDELVRAHKPAHAGYILKISERGSA